MSVVAFVPIRSGSKEVKDKNIKKIHHRPLVYWVLKALQKSEVDKIVVATDSKKYKDIIHKFKFNKVIFYNRDEKNARDNSTTEDVVLVYLGKGYEQNDDTFILMQATNPLIFSRNIDALIETYNEKEYNSLLTVSELKGRFIWEEHYNNEFNRCIGKPINYNYKNRPLRQWNGYNKVYMENGSMYINSVDNIIKSGNRLTEPVGLFIMDYYTHLEIDSDIDFKLIEVLLREFC